jgi:hypothetical protein
MDNETISHLVEQQSIRLTPAAVGQLLPVRDNGALNAIPELAQNKRNRARDRKDSAHAAAVVLPVASHWKPPLLKARTT